MNASAPAAAAMTGFHPTSITLHPPPDDDPLGVALAKALRRDLNPRMTLNLPTVLLLGLVTAGLGPLLILAVRCFQFATTEKFQLEHVNEWIQRGDASPELDTATGNLAARWGVWCFGGFACAGASLVLGVLHVALARGDILSLFTVFLIERDMYFAHGYLTVLTLGYASVLLALARHGDNAHRFIRALGSSNAAEPISSPRMRLPHWQWIVCAVALAGIGAIWGLPMMLAGGICRRYINDQSLQTRTQIAQRIERVMRQRRQPVAATGV